MTAKRSATKKRRADSAKLRSAARKLKQPDGDAPLSDTDFERGHGAMLARRARAVTGLSQNAFAVRFGIPVGSLRDWEQGRRTLDAATRNYLRVIARMPNAVMRVLREAA